MSQISRRRFLRWSAIASGTALLGGFPRWANGAESGAGEVPAASARSGGGTSGEPIKIGIIDPLTSPYKTSSIHDVHGATVAVDLYNKQAGLLGRPVAIVEVDDASNPETAAKAALKLSKEDRVDFLMGTFNGDCALAVSEVAKQEHKLFMVTGAHLPALTGERCDAHMFVFMPSATMLSHAVAPFIVKEYGQRWFMVTADTVDGRSAQEAMAEACRAQKGEVLGSVTTSFGTTDFTEALTKARAANPQAVYEGLRNEIRLYSDALFQKPHIVVLSKRDLLPAGDPLPDLDLDDARGVIAVSSAAGTGLEDLKEYLWKTVSEVRGEEAASGGPDELGVEEEWET